MSAAPKRSSTLTTAFCAEAGRTQLERLHESGALRLRLPRGAACEGIIVNTGGGILAGDRLCLDVALGPASEVAITTVAAEKVYRSPGPSAEIATTLTLGAASRLDWLPQETILFDGARLERRFDIDMAVDASLIAAEMIVFGRVASGETIASGLLRDSWRIRRAGRLVYADETRLEGHIAATLDRKAVADGGRTTALLLMVGPEAEVRLDALRAAFESFASGDGDTSVEAGASTRDGILVARLVARSPERLRAALVAGLDAIRQRPLPRIWL